MKKHISFIINGKVRKIDQLQSEIQRTFGEEFEIHYCITHEVLDGMRLARSAADEYGGYVISVGGDGMLNEVVNGIMQAGVPPGVIAGVLPYGSGNDFSKSIEVGDQPAQLLTLIRDNSVLELDVGVAEHVNPMGEPATRYFMNITDIGLGGEVVQTLHKSKKIFGADFAYSWCIFKGFFTYKKKPVRLKTPDLEWEGMLLSLVMANGRFFGSGYCIAPQADLADGEIAIVIMGKVSVFDYIRHLPGVRKGKRIDHPEVTYASAPVLEVTGVNEPMHIDMDGEYIGTTPLKVSLEQKVLPFLAKKT